MLSRRLSLAPDFSEVTRLNHWLDEAFADAGLDAAAAEAMRLCLNEAVGNTMAYGVRGVAAPEIHLDLTVDAATATAVLIDNGKPFDPTAWPERPKITNLEDATVGGFGIQLIRQNARSMTYERVDGFNRLTIVCGGG